MADRQDKRPGLGRVLEMGQPLVVGVVGLGLIGGSFAKAYADAGVTVYAYNRTASTVEAAMAEGSVTGPLDDSTLPMCDVVILSLYPQATVEWLEAAAPNIAPDTLVIDCGGVKRAICDPCFETAERHGFHFVGGHPMAGTQYSGFRHARVDLYAGQPFVLVPPPIYDPVLIQACQAALSPCGFGTYSVTTPEKHDELIAYTSQLAHVVSSAYIKSPTALRHKGFSAGSYKDLTRVAELNPPMWTELFLDNADNLVVELDRVINELQQYRDVIAEGDEGRLRQLLAEGTSAKLKADGRYGDSRVIM